MMASPSELTLHCKPHNTYSMLLKSSGAEQATATNDQTQTQKLEDFLSCLEKECNEIEAFKRELPLCMQLLNNGIYPDFSSTIFIYTKWLNADLR